MRASSGFLRVDLIGERPAEIVPRMRVWPCALTMMLLAALALVVLALAGCIPATAASTQLPITAAITERNLAPFVVKVCLFVQSQADHDSAPTHDYLIGVNTRFLDHLPPLFDFAF